MPKIQVKIHPDGIVTPDADGLNICVIVVVDDYFDNYFDEVIDQLEELNL